MSMDAPPAVKYREYCYACRRAKVNCLCGSIRPFATRMRFVILMHSEEARNQKTGTGRLAGLCLENSELLVGTDFSNDERVNALLADPSYVPFVLYPGPGAVSFAGLGESAAPPGKTILIFVIDGTWRTARSLLNKSRNVRGLPRISFSRAYLSQFAIKRQPRPHCVATIEAVYHLCREAEEAGREELGRKAEVLMAVFGKLVETQLRYSREHRHRREENGRGR